MSSEQPNIITPRPDDIPVRATEPSETQPKKSFAEMKQTVDQKMANVKGGFSEIKDLSVDVAKFAGHYLLKPAWGVGWGLTKFGARTSLKAMEKAGRALMYLPEIREQGVGQFSKAVFDAAYDATGKKLSSMKERAVDIGGEAWENMRTLVKRKKAAAEKMASRIDAVKSDPRMTNIQEVMAKLQSAIEAAQRSGLKLKFEFEI